jgi:hypothetical protein
MYNIIVLHFFKWFLQNLNLLYKLPKKYILYIKFQIPVKLLTFF